MMVSASERTKLFRKIHSIYSRPTYFNTILFCPCIFKLAVKSRNGRTHHSIHPNCSNITPHCLCLCTILHYKTVKHSFLYEMDAYNFCTNLLTATVNHVVTKIVQQFDSHCTKWCTLKWINKLLNTHLFLISFQWSKQAQY